MAPTAIDFPEARYYGYLDPSSLTAILTRTGNIQALNTVYRGWGILPWATQVVEKQLLLAHGWNWFTYQVTARVLEHNDDETFNRIELTYQTASEQQTYQAIVVADTDKAVYLKGSCNSEKTSEVTPYAVRNLTLMQPIETSRV
jgi:hypothetical protein